MAGSETGDSRHALGRDGETMACAALERRGYRILTRRFRTRFGELDIVAEESGVLVFVEVKARGSLRFGSPEAAVTAHKQERLRRMAQEYLLRTTRRPKPCRFDVVAVLSESGAQPDIRVFRNAF